ncbi:hypothetical protein [Nostoc sp.]|uniref:hypothetical protein n=1 Tax=Nostoc sp. TaxID=1180 RepID=UPI002FFB4AB7
MTITLTQKENSELWAEAIQNSLQNSEPDEFIYQVPRQLGKGYVRNIEVYPDLWLSISDYEYHDDVLIKIPAQGHPLQFCVFLSGIVTDDYGLTQISPSPTESGSSTMKSKSLRNIAFTLHRYLGLIVGLLLIRLIRKCEMLTIQWFSRL